MQDLDATGHHQPGTEGDRSHQFVFRDPDAKFEWVTDQVFESAAGGVGSGSKKVGEVSDEEQFLRV